MAPFRNFLTKKSTALNGGQTENSDSNRPSMDSHRSTPLSVPNYDDSPKEYKLSGMRLNAELIVSIFEFQLENYPADLLLLQLSMAVVPTFRYTLLAMAPRDCSV